METNEQLELIRNETLPVPIASTEIEGLSGTRAKDANETSLRNTVKVSVLKALVSVGQAMPKNEVTFIVDGLRSEILRVFPGIRLEEIGLAIHKTAMGEFGKIFKLTLAVFVSGMRDYMNSESRSKAAKLYMQSTLQLTATTKPTDQEIEKVVKQNCLKAYERFKKYGGVNDYGNVIFDRLVDLGVITSFTQKQVDEFWKQARKNVFSYWRRPTMGSIDRRNEANKILEELVKYPTHYFFCYEAKNLALNAAFTEMVKAKINLSELLT